MFRQEWRKQNSVIHRGQTEMLSWSANQDKEHDECDAALMRLWERQGIELRFSLEEEEEMSTSASVSLKKKKEQATGLKLDQIV